MSETEPFYSLDIGTDFIFRNKLYTKISNSSAVDEDGEYIILFNERVEVFSCLMY